MLSEVETSQKLFFELIRCGIGKGNSLSHAPTPQEWLELFSIAKKQTLAGITFAGIESLPEGQRPPKEIILQWYSQCESIKKQNIDLNKKVAILSQKFKEEGFDNCILKGQGIAQLYPNPLLRTPGDIDIWLDGGDKKVIAYVKTLIPDCKPTYHHVDFPISDDVDIEVHYRPTWLFCPFANRKLQKFFAQQAKAQFCNHVAKGDLSFAAPTVAFNRIYILLHIYRHLFFEGIGVRQLLDYYFVMQQPMTENEKTEYIKLLKSLKLYKFSCAVTYVLQQMFSLSKDLQVVEPNNKEGEFLIREIMEAGNFGKYDSRYKKTQGGFNIAHMCNLIKRSFALLVHYPSEVLWTPYFKIWHLYWRKRNK